MKSSIFRAAFPITIINIPTLSPLEAEEPLVAESTENRNITMRLASRVFRNFWRRQSKDEFDNFRKDVEEAWPGIQIQPPALARGFPPIVQMFYTEDRKDREIQWSGFGFQVWMLMQTHFRRADDGAFLVIDEPDVYLHPDLQRRLFISIRSKFKQFIAATHSIEIINEAEPDELISIDLFVEIWQAGKFRGRICVIL